VRDLERLLGKKTLENEILRRGAGSGTAQKNGYCGCPRPLGTARYEAGSGNAWGGTLQPSRPSRSGHAAQAAADTPRQPRGRRPQPEAELVAEIKALIAGQPTYGYRRIHALVRWQQRAEGGKAVNVKRVYRVTKANGLLLERHTGRTRNAGMTVGSRSIARIPVGARTGLRSAATTVSG
jgi:HTH-like domain